MFLVASHRWWLNQNSSAGARTGVRSLSLVLLADILCTWHDVPFSPLDGRCCRCLAETLADELLANCQHLGPSPP